MYYMEDTVGLNQGNMQKFDDMSVPTLRQQLNLALKRYEVVSGGGPAKDERIRSAARLLQQNEGTKDVLVQAMYGVTDAIDEAITLAKQD